jgi:DNA mismatch repair ATPase MutL
VKYKTPSGKRACRKKRSKKSYIRKSKRKSTGKKKSSKKRKSSKKSSKKRKSPKKSSKKSKKGSKKRKSSKKSSKKRKSPKRKSPKRKSTGKRGKAHPKQTYLKSEKKTPNKLTLENCVKSFHIDHVRAVAKQFEVPMGTKMEMCSAIMRKMDSGKGSSDYEGLGDLFEERESEAKRPVHVRF